MDMVQANGRGPERALHYDRVSTVLQAKGGYSGGPQGFQLDLCRAHSERRGYRVIGEKHDVDSGAKFNIRELMEALEMAKRRELDVLVVAESGRFARNNEKRILLEIEFRKHGVRIEYTNRPVDDTSEGRLMGNILGAFDEWEREKIAWRLGHGKAKKARLGRFVGNGGRVPYGYVARSELDAVKKRAIIVGLQVDPLAADWVRTIFGWALDASILDIAGRLNVAGAPPAGRAARWSFSTVYSILSNSAYKGTARYGRESGKRADTETGEPIAVPALVTERAWARVQLALGERRVTRRGRGARADDRYELRGFLACGHCGGVLSAGGHPDGKRYYRCLRGAGDVARKLGRERCTLQQVEARGVEERAWGHLVGLLLDADALRRGLEMARAEHAAGRRVLEARLEIVRAELAKQERRRRRALEELLDVERDDERYADLDAAAGFAERAGRNHRASEAEVLGELAALPGVSAEEADFLEGFAARVRAGLAEATEGSGAERRRVFELLRLRGTVRYAEGDGPRVGRWAADWTAWAPLRAGVEHAHSDGGMFMLQLLCATDGGDPVVRLRREALP